MVCQLLIKMKVFTILIFTIIILKSSLIYSQTLNDEIITLSNDTIYGQVNSVNNTNVFYDIETRHGISHYCLLLSTVRKIIIDKNNHPYITSAEKADTILYKSENVLSNGKVLVAQYTKFNNWKDKPRSIFFYEGDKVALKCYKNDTIIKKGRIVSFSDSSVLISIDRTNKHDNYKKIVKDNNVMILSDSSGIINAKKINLDDIKEINHYKSGTVLKTGLSIFGGLMGAAVVMNVTFQPEYDEYGDVVNDNTYTILTLAVIAIMDLITIIPAGLIDLASVKYCRMNKDWKLIVTNDKSLY
jgi:hypothetical protein